MVGSLIPEGVQPQASQICAEVVHENPGVVRNVWGYNSDPDHNNRKCVDYMIYDRAGGDQVTQYHLNDRDRLLVDLIIWNRRIVRAYDKPGIPAWTWAPYTGDDPHTSHPHIQYKVGAYVPPAAVKPPAASPVAVGDNALVLATVLNGRAGPDLSAEVVTTRAYGEVFAVLTVEGAWAQDAGAPNAWYFTDYLFPQVKPDPKNPNGIRRGDKVRVTASGGLRARILPGGPVSTDAAGKSIVRPANYQFRVTADPMDGWITGGSNWYSSDYLAKVAPPAPKPPVVKPGWIEEPIVRLSMAQIPSPVNYLQAVVRVAGCEMVGRTIPAMYVLAQDPDNKGNTRFHLFSASGIYTSTMTVRDGGHGATFHAYRSAAGNLYIWTLIGKVAYRIKWQPGKTITATSPGVTRMAYGTARPVGTFENLVGFRAASSTHETFTIHDRFGFTDPSKNDSRPIRKVTVKKRADYTQQSWSMSMSRIYRIMGKTNRDAGNGGRKHILDVFDWSGKLLLDRFDLTAMSLPRATSDEPEGLTFSGTPGSVLAGKRSGPNNRSRTYPIWQMVGLP